MTLRAGETLGPYEILAPLGAGGMGEVYRAIDPRLGRQVAIKVLSDRFVEVPERRQRFEREARAASSLNHPNIVTVYDVGSFGGSTYIAMELIAGSSLRDLLRGTPLALRRMLHIAAQVADGLAKAHAAGIVHRDLKPENVMVLDEGLVKILDFGLAKLSPHTPADGEQTTGVGSGLTEPGVILGTVGYMSPEQAAQLPLDFRSDQFALGSILYEMATGRRAFEERSPVETLNAIIQDEPPSIASLNPAVPAPVRWIIERCLAKEHAERYASTWDLARDLTGVRDHLSEVSGLREVLKEREPERKPEKKLLLRGLASLFIAGLIALGFWASHLATRPAPEFQQVTFRRGYLPSARFSPDGKTIIYAAAWEGHPLEIATTRAGSADARLLGGPPADVLSVSRNEEIALLMDRHYALGALVNAGTLARVSLSGGAPRELAKEVQAADWSPDGTQLAIVRDERGRSRLEYPIGTVLYETSGWISSPRVSPSGDEVAFLDHPARGDDAGAVAIVTRAGKLRVVSPGWMSAKGLAWSPAGDAVWVTAAKSGIARSLYSVSRGGRERLLLQVTGRLTLQDVAPDGRVLICSDTERAGMAGRSEPGDPERDLSWLDVTSIADISPDGRNVLFTEFGEAAGARYSVFLRGMDGSAAVRLGDGIARSFSPDGRWALCNKLGNRPRQLVLLPTGAGEQRAVTADRLDHDRAIWLPGDRLLFTGNEPAHGGRLFVQEIANGIPRPISPEGTALTDKSTSFDGKWAAAIDGSQNVTLYPTDGLEAPRLVRGLERGEVPISCGPEGTSLLVYRRGSELPVRIVRVDAITARREVFRELTPPDAAGIVSVIGVRMTSDGRAYAYSYIRILSELFVMSGLS